MVLGSLDMKSGHEKKSLFLFYRRNGGKARFITILTRLDDSSTVPDMFNLGLPELFVIGAAALLVFGPKRLPEWAKGLGEGVREFKKALGEEDASKNPPGQSSKPESLPPPKDPR
jgi:sec-independent protein translocase protein TatA